MGIALVWLVMSNGTVIHDATHPIVADVRAVGSAELMVYCYLCTRVPGG